MRPFVRVLRRFGPPAVFTLAVLFSLYTTARYPAHFIDSDLSSELVLGKLLSVQHRLITTDWFYSTEIRFFSTNLVYAPLFWLFSDWQTVRVAASVIFQTLLLLSYHYLSRQLKLSKNAYFLSAAMMILPVSVLYGRMILYQNYYACNMIYGFMIAGLYLSVLAHRGRRGAAQGLRAAALLALAFVSCLNGFRQLPFTLAPLLLVALYLAARAFFRGGRKLAGIPGEARLAVALAAGLCLMGFAGLLVHMKILPLYSSYRLLNRIALQPAAPAQLRRIAQSYVSLFGWQGGRALYTLGGAANLAGLFAAAAMLVLGLAALFPKQTALPQSVGRLLYPVAMLITLCIFGFTTGADNYPQYFITAFVWIYPFFGLLLDGCGRPAAKPLLRRLQQALAGALVLCFLLSGAFYGRYFINPEGKQVIYDGYTFLRPDFRARQQGAVHYLLDNGFEAGYATFWQANSVTEASNGRIAMIPVLGTDTGAAFAYQDWLTDKTLRDRAFVQGKKTFLLLTAEEQTAFAANPLVPASAPVYQDAYCAVYALAPPDALWQQLHKPPAP